MDKFHCIASIHHSTRTLPEGEYRWAYGTCGYKELVVDDQFLDTACRTEDGECEFFVSGESLVRVDIVKGDPARIRQLVQAEIEHFDTELTWSN